MSDTQQVSVPFLDEGDINLTPHRKAWLRENVSAGTLKYLEEDARHFLHQSLSTPCLDVLARCEGSWIEDLEGRRFLDFHGNSVHQVGFANPRVIKAIKDQLDTLSFCPRRFTNIAAIKLAAKLADIAPGNLRKVLFAPGGTTAVGMALKLARVATGRFKTISMWDSFHGASLDAISIGGETLFRRGIGPLLPGSEHVPAADPYRCMWNPQGDCEQCDLRCAAYIEFVLEREGDVAAVIAEPLRCTTGTIPPPGYWEAVREACHRHGALLIFDETALCLGRTGRMFACENFQVVPDILILGKGLGGGIMPQAAIITREDLDLAGDKALGHYTHEKNPVAGAAGLAALEFIEEERLIAKVQEQGIRTLECLRKMQTRHPLIGDVRGMGFLWVLDLVVDRAGRKPAVEHAEKLMYKCLSKGMSFKISHGNCVTLTPPLTITNSELTLAMGILDASLLEMQGFSR